MQFIRLQISFGKAFSILSASKYDLESNRVLLHILNQKCQSTDTKFFSSLFRILKLKEDMANKLLLH